MATAKENEMWAQADNVFEEADKAFRLFEDVIKEQKGRVKAETTSNADRHTLKFKAENWAQRRKLATCFMKMAAQILRDGTTSMRFRR